VHAGDYPLVWTGAARSRCEHRVTASTDDRTADEVVGLYEKYGPLVYARCRRLLGDAAAAEDLTQDTFLRVHRHMGAIPETAKVLPWLYRISTNLCLNAIRDGRARAIPVRELPDRAGDDDPGELLVTRDLVTRLIARASPKVRVAAWLYHVDGMKQEEIAEVLGISRRAVVKRLSQFGSRSRKFIRAVEP
jgi:RNA polymerase sigma-70 factor, ECF subfamily